ncbi:MAG: hypothetical protein V4611_04170 [Patescibacteria group bacterium]
MATTKKTPAKKITKVKSTKSTARPWSWRFSVVTIGIYAIVVATIVVAALSASTFISAQQSKERLSRIETIYSNINLNDSYKLEASNVFGDKRVYEWDDGRTYASSASYIHADTVSNTVADLDGKIKSSGFSFIDEPYPGSTYTQYHYKSANGEYIRLTVSSKPYDDGSFNAFVMDKDSLNTVLPKLDTNAGPSNVIIKVNLDDNNE